MTCDDTLENRAKLRKAGFFWSPVFAEDGTPSGLIRAYTPEETTARRESVWQSRKPIMVDPSSAYSEYISPLDYPSDYPAPWWIKNSVRQYLGQAREGKPEEKRVWLATRCKVVRNDGTRCWNWVSRRNETKCKQHLGWVADQHSQLQRVAKTRILQASVVAADTLEELIYDKDQSGAVRLKASTEVLDRAGIRGGVELEVSGEIETKDAGGEVSERLERLAKRMAEAASKVDELSASAHGEEPVDAEIVEEETPIVSED
jgi:hypothetical protein